MTATITVVLGELGAFELDAGERRVLRAAGLQVPLDPGTQQECGTRIDPPEARPQLLMLSAKVTAAAMYLQRESGFNGPLSLVFTADLPDPHPDDCAGCPDCMGYGHMHGLGPSVGDD